MDDLQRLRYSRHLLLNEWSEDLQERLLSSHVLVIGAGGLGAPALMYLASSGVGRITVVDHDQVDLSNLQRQVIHDTAAVGHAKVDSVQSRLERLNPEVHVQAVARRADPAWLDGVLPNVDLVLDCTDRFASRQMVNQACVQHRKPLVFASAVRWSGQSAMFASSHADSPCYACVFPPDEPPEDVRCATLGVFAPLVGQMGVMQASMALRWLSGVVPPSALLGRLTLVDGLSGEHTVIRLRKSAHCPVCGPREGMKLEA